MSNSFSDLDHSLQQVVSGLAKGQTRVIDFLAALNGDLVSLIKTEGEELRHNVKSQLNTMHSVTEEAHQRKQLQDSLYFREINDRVNTIQKSHRATFEWIFDSETERGWDSFVAWLGNGERIYWISGKPASGKSVLMKFIVQHSKTPELLSSWADGKPVFQLSFFTWKGGTSLQRQKKGLLCSLVLQLINKSQAYLSRVLSSSDNILKRSPGDWSMEELSDILAQLAKMRLAKVCLFADGLDETESTDGDTGMLGLMEWLASLEDWKVCVASRPEPDFQAVLARYPKLCLQDLTQDDLRQFAVDKLQEVDTNEYFANQGEQPVPERLVDLVCEKAEGVFLWVRFAVSTIIRGVRRMDDWNDFMKRLARLPSELEQLYLDMWQRGMEDQSDYRAEAARYFSLVMSAQEEPLSCFDLMVLESKDAQRLFDDSEAPPSLHHLLRNCRRVEQRIVSCSRGFLECKKVDRSTPWSRSEAIKLTLVEDDTPSQLRAFRHRQVTFVHRTIIDFLQDTAIGRQVLSDDSSQSYDCSKIKIDALLVSPYCEYPIVDLFDFRKVFEIMDAQAAIEEKVTLVQKFEMVHIHIIRANRSSEPADIVRNWVDAVEQGQWTPFKGFSVSKHGFPWRPAQYAIGWTSHVAEAGLIPYFQQLLSDKPEMKLNKQYLTCLAACVAGAFPVHNDVHAHAILQLELLKYLHDLGADMTVRHAVGFGLGSSLNCLSMFCTLHHRTEAPTQNQRNRLLSGLRQLMTDDIDYSQVSVFSLHVHFINWVTRKGVFHVSINTSNATSDISRPWQNTCIVQFNLTALLRFYMQAIGVPEEQVAELLQYQVPPEWKLVALRTAKSESKFRRILSIDDSESFCSRLDQCASFGQMTLLHPNEDVSPNESQTYETFLKTLLEVYDRAAEVDYHEFMQSEGYWTSAALSPSDIPFLRPFDDAPSLDCSNFMQTS